MAQEFGAPAISSCLWVGVFPDLPAQFTVSFPQLVPEERRETEAEVVIGHSMSGSVLGALFIGLRMI